MAQVRDGLTMDLYGEEELNNFFHKTLTFGQQKSVMLSAYRKAGKPLIDTARQLLRSRRKSASKGSSLDKSFGMKPMRSKKPALLVGSRRFGGFKGFHGHLVDSGTVKRYRKTKNGKVSTGTMPALNIWSDALQKETPGMIQNMRGELIESLNRLVQRNLKKQAKVN